MNQVTVAATAAMRKWRVISNAELRIILITSCSAAFASLLMVNESTFSVQWMVLLLTGIVALASVSISIYRAAEKKKQWLVLTLLQYVFIILGVAFFILTALSNSKLFGDHPLLPIFPIFAFMILGVVYGSLLVKEKFRVK